MAQPAPTKLGKYEIRKELGKGAMGVVYLAYDTVLEREVALKVMASTILSDEDLKQRFEREAKAVAKLQHPNIVTVYDLGYDDSQGAPFIAMELLKGTDLEQRIRKNPPSLPEKLTIVAEVCRGLAHAHQNGIVHRDVKPANVFVTEAGGTKIMDFGVARWTQSSQTQSGAVMGTADYMSPEQIRGQRVDGKSDIFSVGVILYRLLTHKKPFVGENIQAVFYKILNVDTPELMMPDGGSFPELQAIVDKALAKNIDERYQNADELADDIYAFLRAYEGSLSQDTIFGTAFEVEAEHSSGRTGTSGTGRRSTLRPGTDVGRTGSRLSTAPSISRTHRAAGTGVATTLRRPSELTTSGSATGTNLVPPHALPGTQMSPSASGRTFPRPVVVPRQERSPWIVVALAVILAVIAGGVYYYVTIPEPPPATGATATPVGPPPVAAPPVDVSDRLAVARELLDKGRIADAYEQVNLVLKMAPDHPEAIALREKIMNAPAERASVSPLPVAPTVRPTPTPLPPDERKTAATLVNEKVTEAALAIANGDLAGAQVLIAEGQKIDRTNSKWAELSRQLEQRRRELEMRTPTAADQQKAERVTSHIRAATDFMVAQDYTQAIASYKRALDLDPSNQTALQGLGNATQMQAQLNAQRQVQRLITQTETRYIAASSKANPSGFITDDKIEAKRATGAPPFPAELNIEINPSNAQPGQPYELIVQLSNSGQKTINLKPQSGLEIVHSYQGRPPIGQGQPLQPVTRTILAGSTGLLYRQSAKWNEDQNKGQIQVTVTLVNDDKLTKTISW